MTLPDNSFFELLGSVFGKIKTPFNKQILLADLEMFLLREDIQKNIACYFDLNDARIIAAAAVLGEPAPGDLEGFFSGELSYAELHDLIINLEERFIFYRFQENGLSRLALNPVLEPVLSPLIKDTSLLFPSLDASDAPPDAPRTNLPLNDRILAGLLSFVLERETFFRNEGEILKRVSATGNKIFPGLDLVSVIGGLRAIGLFRSHDAKLVPDYRYFADFGKLSPLERMEYCAAGIYCFRSANAPGAVSPYLFQTQVRNMTGFIHRFLNSLEAKRLYPDKTLKRLAGILKYENTDTMRAVPALAASGEEKNIDSGILVECLEMSGLLLPVSAGYRRLGPLAAQQAGPETAAEPAGAKSPVIVMDTAFSCLVYPEISYTDAVSLASMLAVRDAGLSLRFDLTRDSAIRAFNRSISAAGMIELLKRLSADRIDESLIWTLRDWEGRYGEVSLRRGLVLSLSPERRYLAEMESLSCLIKETLAPGLYLLSETAEDKAIKSLQKAGVNMVACRTESADKTGASGAFRSPFPPPASVSQSRKKNLRAFVGPSPDEKTRADTASSASALIAGFFSILEQMRDGGTGPRLGKAEHDELAARINRRLVLCESQLRDASVRYEKLEARSLDYVGKAMIAKQAIAFHSPVEIIRSGKSGERLFGIPTALEKKGGESILIISPLEGGGDSLRIPLGKISLLRRIKKSIFENSSRQVP
ncbi:MAG: hypothetical protein LBG57_13865 [Treponema sp.]|jgi:hypothetical protein|nr:hypothetical protein [Treponema sp.]